MKRMLCMMSGLLLVAFLVTAAPSAPTGTPVSSAPAGEKSLSTLRRDIENLLKEREDALRGLSARYAAAPLDQRVALEAEGAKIQTDYERRYLEMVVDYHRLTGHNEELARAQAMLENLNAGVVTGTPLALPRNLRDTQTSGASDQLKEGVVRNDQ